MLKLEQVEAATGYKKSIIYEWIREGTFPAQCKLGRTSRWRSTDINKWIQETFNQLAA
ncbi:AlpA family phage regulatory protein [Yersinia enterocolitica]|nr:AlpA family phage regulatory protein [Yersinia enterocolitica]EKN3879380.1 AlpA family phage regulatory protein [Yersinia enterocolitica]EKN4742195.1 AlpA family phage regulatory protein [Yersinia enterocolitica]EKN4838706.1 AlpA family phage regulatory protein [Yersinia enterocolitica]ELI7926026.1 AlpA family phage regulatory protein [Yersinia enterocolitica]